MKATLLKADVFSLCLDTDVLKNQHFQFILCHKNTILRGKSRWISNYSKNRRKHFHTERHDSYTGGSRRIFFNGTCIGLLAPSSGVVIS